MRPNRRIDPDSSKERRTPTFRRDPHQEKGQAFVELALVIPVFTLMLVGIVEFGRLAYASIEVNNAARAGVAYASQSTTTAQDTTNIKRAAVQDASNVTSLTTLNTTTSYSCTCESTTGSMTTPGDCSLISTASGSCPSPSRIAVYVQVNTAAPVNTLFHFPGFPNTVTLRGQATMRVLQ